MLIKYHFKSIRIFINLYDQILIENHLIFWGSANKSIEFWWSLWCTVNTFLSSWKTLYRYSTVRTYHIYQRKSFYIPIIQLNYELHTDLSIVPSIKPGSQRVANAPRKNERIYSPNAVMYITTVALNKYPSPKS